MIEHIRLSNFKVSKNINLPIAALTVLAGLNGAGKSTSLQALALLRQSYEKSGNTAILALAGSLVRLGEGEDILSETALTDQVTLKIIENGKPYTWEFEARSQNKQLNVINPPDVAPFLYNKNFQFLQADRITPKTLFPQSNVQNEFLGVGGEYTIDYLSRYGDQIVVNEMRCASLSNTIPDELISKIASTSRLNDQVAAWLQFLSPGVRLKLDRIKGTDDVQLQFNYVSHVHDLNQNRRPTNVGFGLTYSLPIIVACLASPKGSLLLLENPEAHLHPRGQAALGELLARCAADGVQIIVETHSDHLLDGIRLATKNSLIQANQVAMHFFTRSYETGDANVASPKMHQNGKLDFWPDGFFDQALKNSALLARRS